MCRNVTISEADVRKFDTEIQMMPSKATENIHKMGQLGTKQTVLT